MCLYYKYKSETCTVVGVYVDALLVTGTEQSAVDFFAEMSSLSIKDLGAVNKLLALIIDWKTRINAFWIKRSRSTCC